MGEHRDLGATMPVMLTLDVVQLGLSVILPCNSPQWNFLCSLRFLMGCQDEQPSTHSTREEAGLSSASPGFYSISPPWASSDLPSRDDVERWDRSHADSCP